MSVDNSGNKLRWNKRERRQKPDMPFNLALALSDFGKGGAQLISGIIGGRVPSVAVTALEARELVVGSTAN